MRYSSIGALDCFEQAPRAAKQYGRDIDLQIVDQSRLHGAGIDRAGRYGSGKETFPCRDHPLSLQMGQLL